MGTGTIYWWRTSFGEDEAAKIREAILAEHLSMGPVTAEFERKFAASLDVPYAVATTSGSSALMMSLMAVGVGPGDEVIVPNRTFIATAHAATLLGATVKLVDVLPEIPAMDTRQLRKKITSRTKAVMPVHLNGRSVNMDQTLEVAGEYGLAVVEDACQALYSRNKSGYLGTQGDAGCFSLSVAKLISTAQGGMVVTRRKDIYEKLRLARTHGVPDTFSGTFDTPGFNFRMTDIQASIGLVQLAQSKQRIASVKAVQRRYAAGLAEMPFIKMVPVNEAAGEVPLYVEALSDERERILRFMEEKDIQIRPLLPDLHLSPHLKNTGESFPNSRKFSEEGMYLPGGPSQPIENVDRVIAALAEYGTQR
jgi:dTDP-4-amino-4,6-dideoxygalactose transaminase